MKNKIIYIASFLAAFLIVTFGIIYFNSVYKDIFQFDFTKKVETKKKTEAIISDTTNIQMAVLKDFLHQQLKNYVLDSLKNYVGTTKVDTIISSVVKDSSLIDSLKTLSSALIKTNSELAKQEELSKSLEKDVDNQPDSLYREWTKKTAKLYEIMDPAKAAKIIQGYSDNVARDLIYSMKKNKASEILAAFSPENANRIMRAK